MGLFRNLQPARRAEEAVDRVLEEVEARAAQGLREFVVTMSQSDIGTMNRLDVVAPWVVEALQDAGHAVLAVDLTPWTHQANFRVRAADEALTSASVVDEDPDLQQLHRSMSLIEQHPMGNAALTPWHIPTESQASRRQLEAGEFGLIWQRRLRWGFAGIPQSGSSDEDLFWLHAASAVAALRLGLREHPLTASSCGLAEQHHNRDDMSQVAVVGEFTRLFFSDTASPPTATSPPSPQPPSDASDGSPGADLVAQLAKLADLAESGHLSPAEFQQAKQRLLGY